MACENAQWAKIIWEDSYAEERSFYTQSPPITYELNAVSATPPCQGEAYYCITDVEIYNPLQDCSHYASRFPNGNTYYVPAGGYICLQNCGSEVSCGTACNFEKRATYSGGGSSLMPGWFFSGDYIPYSEVPGCELIIYDSRGEVFRTSFDDSCPLIEVVCSDDSCPENTCSVECFDHICCVDRLGKVVKSIKK